MTDTLVHTPIIPIPMPIPLKVAGIPESDLNRLDARNLPGRNMLRKVQWRLAAHLELVLRERQLERLIVDLATSCGHVEDVEERVWCLGMIFCQTDVVEHRLFVFEGCVVDFNDVVSEGEVVDAIAELAWKS